MEVDTLISSESASRESGTLSLKLRGYKRVVSQKGGFGESALFPIFGTGEHLNVPSLRFLVPGNI